MKNDAAYSLYFSETGLTLSCILHFSDRKTISIQIKEDASIHVRAPYYVRSRQVEAFIEEKKDWIYSHYMQIKKKQAAETPPSLSPLLMQQADMLKTRFLSAAHTYFPKRCAELVLLTGGSYKKITIRNQKTRWGSCSQTGTLSFNYRLMMAPPEIIDYVIVHELCHLTYMDHSKAFWDKVGSHMPDYARRKNWLKEHGSKLTEIDYLLSLM